MIGPLQLGHLHPPGGVGGGRPFQFLRPGARYRVLVPFTDYDGHRHESGESWVFLTSSFLPHEDGLSLFVSLDGENEWQIRLQWRSEQQAPILDALGTFLAEIT